MRGRGVLAVAALVTVATLLPGCGGGRNPGTMMLPGVSQLHWSPVERIPPQIEQELSASLIELDLQLLTPVTPAPNHSERLVAWVSTWMYAPSKETQADFGITQTDRQPLSLSTHSGRFVVPKDADKVPLRGTTSYIVRGIRQTTYGPPDWVLLAWKEPGHPATTVEFDTAWMDEKTMRGWLEDWQWFPRASSSSTGNQIEVLPLRPNPLAGTGDPE